MAEIKPLKLGTSGSEQFATGDSIPVANGGVPSGGNSDEVLVKSSNADFDLAWTPVPIQSSLQFSIEPPVNLTGQGVFTASLNAGTTVAAFECVYLGSGGTWLLADADTEATSIGMLALSMESKTSGQAMNVAFPGSIVRNDSWNWTVVGGIIYLSQTAGALTQTAPTGTDVVQRIIGYALTDDCIYFNPSRDYITLI